MTAEIHFILFIILVQGAVFLIKFSRDSQGKNKRSAWYDDLADALYFTITGEGEVIKRRKAMSNLDRGVMEVVLKRYNTFYQNLSPRNQIKFQRRMMYHYSEKRYFAKEGLKLTREMKVVISAAAAQLTFGLEDYELPRFHTYVLYPDIFQLLKGKPYLKGGTISGGLVYFSWKHVKHGFRVKDDGVNLAIHELAHALKIQGHFSMPSDYDWVDDLNVWLANSAEWIQQASKEDQEFFRKNMLKDAHERFATAVEVFFEQPVEFEERFPRVYRGLVELLRQDPAKGQNTQVRV
ncbi:zinc-dependent peptidase [bacterium SCSIO 12741]|nr:zinc-dependent peptidase [bacterium SCSIO 12741]